MIHKSEWNKESCTENAGIGGSVLCRVRENESESWHAISKNPIYNLQKFVKNCY